MYETERAKFFLRANTRFAMLSHRNYETCGVRVSARHFLFFSLFSFFLFQPNETKGRPALFFLEKWGESFVRDEKEEGKKERKGGFGGKGS